MLKLKFSNTDNKCVKKSKSTLDSNILDLFEVKQTVNTPTIITTIVNKAVAKTSIFFDLKHELNMFLSMKDVN